MDRRSTRCDGLKPLVGAMLVLALAMHLHLFPSIAEACSSPTQGGAMPQGSKRKQLNKEDALKRATEIVDVEVLSSYSDRGFHKIEFKVERVVWGGGGIPENVIVRIPQMNPDTCGVSDEWDIRRPQRRRLYLIENTAETDTLRRYSFVRVEELPESQ